MDGQNSGAIGGGHRIDLSRRGLEIDGSRLTSLAIDELSRALGEPRVVAPDARVEAGAKVPKSLVIWDDAGVWAWSADLRFATELGVMIAEDAEWADRVTFDIAEKRPRGTAADGFTIDGGAPLAAIPENDLREAYLFVDLELGDWDCTLMLTSEAAQFSREMEVRDRLAAIDSGAIAADLRSQQTPFREASISHRAPAKSTPPAPSRSWEHAAPEGPVLRFDTPAFGYAVVQHLMYDRELLSPAFDVHAFAADIPGVDAPLDNDGTVIPEVAAWFATLPVPTSLADQVEELYLDGGNDIYLQLAPQWDGEDEAFAIPSISPQELAQFPRLTTVEDVGGFLGDEARRRLTAAGITIVD